MLSYYYENIYFTFRDSKMIENEDEPVVAKSRNGKKHFFAPSASPEVESMGSALLNLSFYSFLMFTVPLGVFFIGNK